MSIDAPETNAHAELMGRINNLSAAVTAALQDNAAGLPLATVIGVLESIKLDAHHQALTRYEAAMQEMQQCP